MFRPVEVQSGASIGRREIPRTEPSPRVSRDRFRARRVTRRANLSRWYNYLCAYRSRCSRGRPIESPRRDFRSSQESTSNAETRDISLARKSLTGYRWWWSIDGRPTERAASVKISEAPASLGGGRQAFEAFESRNLFDVLFSYYTLCILVIMESKLVYGQSLERSSDNHIQVLVVLFFFKACKGHWIIDKFVDSKDESLYTKSDSSL